MLSSRTLGDLLLHESWRSPKCMLYCPIGCDNIALNPDNCVYMTQKAPPHSPIALVGCREETELFVFARRSARQNDTRHAVTKHTISHTMLQQLVRRSHPRSPLNFPHSARPKRTSGKTKDASPPCREPPLISRKRISITPEERPVRTYRPSSDKTIQPVDTTKQRLPSVTSVKQNRTTRSGFPTRYSDVPRSTSTMPRTYIITTSQGGPQA